MLSPADDYPVHQTGQPIAHPATGDRNHYDRYFFNGYDREGGFFFGAALGVYPNRRVIDAAFSVVHDGVQRAVHTSGTLPLDRMATSIGPIRLEVVEPLRTLRIVVDAPEQGISADVTFAARTPAVEEPRNISHDGTALRQDYTRATQWGTWQGSVTTGATRLACDPASVLGTRDRSWGVRPVGEPPGGAPGLSAPQFFWLWAPLHFDDHCTHLALVDDARGRHTYESATRIPLLAEGGDAGSAAGIVHHRLADHEIEWEPGTRRARRARITVTPWEGEPQVTELEPFLTFQMLGLGYLHPEWGHGTYKGESATGGSEWRLDELDPLAFPHLHVQQLCRVDQGGQQGVGVLEQLVFGPHEPSGFTGLLDGAGGMSAGVVGASAGLGVRPTPEAITPGWLTEVLRASGALERAAVTTRSVEVCGTGQLGDCYRLTLAYDRVEAGAPSTLVAKLPSADPTSRDFAGAAGLYAKEVRFYQEVAPDLAIRTPHAFHAAIEADGVSFDLLLEDLAPATACDQLTGCDPDQAALVMEHAAAMHASSWDPSWVATHGWLGREGSWAALAEHMPVVHALFSERYGDVLEPEHLEVADRLRDGIGGWAVLLDERRCAWHLDFRLDNMLFEARDGEVPLAVVDWQSVSVGPGVADVSYFLGAGLPVELRRRHEEDLVRHYHAALCGHGVAGYDWERCWQDYRAHAVLGFFTAVNASVNVKRTDRGDEMFLTMARRHGDQIRTNGTLELIGA